MKETLYIVMPAYNEESNIRAVIAEWYSILENANDNSKLVVADGGSKDNTLKILYELQKQYPKLEVLSYPGTDHGTKVIILCKYAIEKGADWIFQTDSDGQTLPSEFSQFWAVRSDFDAVLGNRRVHEDGRKRKFVENVLRIYLWLFFGCMIPDANAPFRLMRSMVVRKYIDLMPANFSLPNAILSECFTKFHDRVTYFEVTFHSRRGGKNFMNLKRIFKIGWESIGSFYRLRKDLRNAKFNS